MFIEFLELSINYVYCWGKYPNTTQCNPKGYLVSFLNMCG